MFKNVLSGSNLLSDYRNCQLFNVYKSVYYLFLTRVTSPSSLQLEFDSELDVPVTATVAGDRRRGRLKSELDVPVTATVAGVEGEAG